MASSAFHVHFNSRRTAPPVFQMTEELCRAALARRPDLAGKVRMTLGWDLEGFADAMKTAQMTVGFRFPTADLRNRAPHLKIIHLIGAGVEHLRPFDWVPKGLAIINNRGIHEQKAGEFVLMALLLLNNRMPALIAAQAGHRWQQTFTGQLKGKTVLVIGVGKLGGAGAREARRFGLEVIGIRRSGKAHRHCHEMHPPEALRALLPRADFVLVTVPSTVATDGLIGAAELDLMRPGAGFVNFSRAATVDYGALAERLRSGAIGGAVLDVFDPEPLPAESPLWDTPNLLITPHCSSDDAERYIPMTLDLVLENIARSLAGRPLLNKVDLRREY